MSDLTLVEDEIFWSVVLLTFLKIVYSKNKSINVRFQSLIEVLNKVISLIFAWEACFDDDFLIKNGGGPPFHHCQCRNSSLS